MAADFDQTPDDVRHRAGGKHRVVPGFRAHAEGDPDYADRLLLAAGFGAYGAVTNVRERREARRRNLTRFANGIEASGDIGYREAVDFENADNDGKAGVKSEEL